MRPRPFLVLVAFVSLSCGGGSNGTDPQRDWQDVLHRKRAAQSPTASVVQKQVYADSLGAFLRKHPDHSRARAVYERIQLDFARELAAHGRYQDAIRFYRAILAHDPNNGDATAALEQALDRLAVSRAKLLALQKGMSQHQVAQLLGRPIPGWTRTNDRREPAIESWYYRTTEGGVAGVYFRDGVVFGAEASSDAKVTPLAR